MQVNPEAIPPVILCRMIIEHTAINASHVTACSTHHVTFIVFKAVPKN